MNQRTVESPPAIPKLVYLVTVPITARAFLRGQLAAMKAAGFDVLLISSPGPELNEVAVQEGVRVAGIPMQRTMNPWRDLIALGRLVRLLRRERPAIVNASTPKAGLLGMLAAWFVRTPVRIYLQRGLRLETTHGVTRLILTATERLTAACAQHVVCNSPSLRQRYLDLRLAPAAKVKVLGAGSSNGVDAARFLPTAETPARAASLAARIGLPAGAPVIGFVGRFTRDKGFVELAQAFARVQQRIANAQLLLVGDFETGDPVPPAVVADLAANSAIHQTGFVKDAAPYYHCMDVLAFPSFREGLPNAPLEAALAGAPTVGFRATGVVDVVLDGETGLLAPIGDPVALADGLITLLENGELRRTLGNQARERALREFRPEVVWGHWVKFYHRCSHHVSSPP